MEWNILVSDADAWVMYRVFICGLVYTYEQDIYKILAASYTLSSLSYILSFGLSWMQGSLVHHMFTYPVAVCVGVFCAAAVKDTPSKHPVLHILSTLPWVILGFHGTLGYTFIFPYIVAGLIAQMYNWTTFSAISMMLIGAMTPLHSPLISLCVPVAVLLAYSRFQDIYHDTPFVPDV